VTKDAALFFGEHVTAGKLGAVKTTSQIGVDYSVPFTFLQNRGPMICPDPDWSL